MITRFGLTASFQPAELVILRYGVSGLLLIVLSMHAIRTLRPDVWREGVFLAACHGAPLAFLLFEGLRRAPAAHSPAIMQGLIPVWVAIWLAVARRQPIAAARLYALGLVLLGTLGLGAASARGSGSATLAGDLFFVAASALAGMYFVRMQLKRTPGTIAAMLVAVYSSAAVLGWWACCGDDVFQSPTWSEIGVQALVQGVLLGVVSMLTLNAAIAFLGSQAASVFLAGVPAVTLLIGWLALDERPRLAEAMAIAVVILGMLLFARAAPVGR